VEVILDPSRNGAYLLGSDAPLIFDQVALAGLLGSPNAATDFATAPDDPGLDGAGWARTIMAHDWLRDGQVDAFVGSGPVITDDRPISEYYLLRFLTATDHSDINEERLRALTPSAPP
jgi:hypothetical protein